jgi:hypothetical protein
MTFFALRCSSCPFAAIAFPLKVPTPCALHPGACTLHPTPYTLHPTPYTLHPTPYTTHPEPYTLHSAPYTLHPTLHTVHSEAYTLNSRPTSKLTVTGPRSLPHDSRLAFESTLASLACFFCLRPQDLFFKEIFVRTVSAQWSLMWLGTSLYHSVSANVIYFTIGSDSE